MSTPNKKRVLIVDDSALIRAVLSEIINSDPRMEVVETASDPYDAREKIRRINPDVLTLDIEMPKMNGIAFLKNLMRLRPMPVVMISTLTQQGAPITLEALELGAVDFVAKPVNQSGSALEAYRQDIVDKVYHAARANIRSAEPKQKPSYEETLASPGKYKPGMICAIGASTGGTEAIKEVIRKLPANSPPVVIAQHIPEAFSGSFARRVDSLSQVTVYEAKHNQKITGGCVYIAPGHSHLKVVSNSFGYICKLDEGPPVNRHRPSVEVLFNSVGEAAGKKAVGILLTGMGADGAEGLLNMQSLGCAVAIQDEASSVVWGMPGAAYKLGVTENVLPLNNISHFLLKSVSQ